MAIVDGSEARSILSTSLMSRWSWTADVLRPLTAESEDLLYQVTGTFPGGEHFFEMALHPTAAGHRTGPVQYNPGSLPECY
jgi:hypothetical protein